MKKLLLILIILTALSTVNAQNIVNEFGGSVNTSLMNSDYGLVLGLGSKLDNRVNFARSNFVLKNSIGLTTYDEGDYKSKTTEKAHDYLWMFDVMAEYNLFSFGDFHRNSVKSWTPYIGAGVNAIYRSTKTYNNRVGSNGFYFTMKGSLGLKFKLNNRVVVFTEGYLEWDFKDKLDGFANNPDKWWRYDHTANISIGITYIIRANSSNRRLPWSGIK